MYQYNSIDHTLVAERVAQFRDQTRRYLEGDLSEDEFRPLRLQNGLYIQRQAPMLRVAIPYGLLSSAQLHKLAHIARTYDRGYGHFTTRQNIQFNWPSLESVPDILTELAKVEMHAIQTSGNCIRNTTSDHFAGVAHDEIIDPRPVCELIRQWSTLHPEFAYLPRKFKIAVSSSIEDRAATFVHDIGLHVLRDPQGEIGVRVIVGGGLGRTPVIGRVIREFLPRAELLNYLDAILRIYNRFGRRDNKYKARIKILVRELGIDKFREEVEGEFAHLIGSASTIPAAESARLETAFVSPPYLTLPHHGTEFRAALAIDRAFARWVKSNVFGHKVPGYVAVTLSLKRAGIPPGDIDAATMDAVANLADRYSFSELRVSHEQNLVLADVEERTLPALWREARALGLATPNIGLLTNLIACPGGDFCSLANARSLPVAAEITARFQDLDQLHDLGPIDLNISGCINSCGHHHVGHIGILGVDKDGAEWYQVTLGGAQGVDAALGRVIGRSFAADEIADAVETIIETFVDERQSAETFLSCVQRIGLEPFKARLYGTAVLKEAA